MKKYLYIAVALLAMLAWLQHKTIVRDRVELQRYKSNTETLLDTITRYKVRDSLNAAKTGVLELTIKEYKKYRAEDARLIEELKLKGRSLKGISTASTGAKYTFGANIRDTIIQRDTIKIQTRCADYENRWITFHGCEQDGKFDAEVAVRDSLLIVESVRYKRFLGFLWRTKRIKDKRVDVVSRNPYNNIIGIEHVELRY